MLEELTSYIFPDQCRQKFLKKELCEIIGRHSFFDNLMNVGDPLFFVRQRILISIFYQTFFNKTMLYRTYCTQKCKK